MPCLLCVHAPVHALVRREKAAPRQKESAEDSEGIKNDFSVTADIEIDNMPLFRENRLTDALFIGCPCFCPCSCPWSRGRSYIDYMYQQRTATTTSKIANQATLSSSIGFQQHSATLL